MFPLSDPRDGPALRFQGTTSVDLEFLVGLHAADEVDAISTAV